jgi:DNA topoisomerase-1
MTTSTFARDVSRQARRSKGDREGGRWTSSGSIPLIRTPSGGYVGPDGSPLPEADRIRVSALKIPPAWASVRISNDPHSPLQATGIDRKGRVQYRYSATHAGKASAAKFARVKVAVQAMPRLRRELATSLASADPAENEPAAVLTLIERTGFRVGSDKDTKGDSRAIGASTLKSRNVSVENDVVTFSFTAKHGVRVRRRVRDPVLASVLAPRLDRHGRLFDATDADVRDWLRRHGFPFVPKDIRGVVASETALAAMSKLPVPKSVKGFKKAKNQVADAVARRLGNTRAVCLKSYIAPEVFAPWLAALHGMGS